MTPTVAFILGLLIGLIVEWVIDWLYWRRRQAALQAELDQAKAKLAAAGSANSGLKGRLSSMADSDSLQQRISVLEADKVVLNQQLLTLSAEKSSLAEQLTACQGKLSAAALPLAVAAPTVPVASVTPSVTGLDAPTVRTTQPVSVEPDDLLIIKGIGPVINHRLNQGGIYTFEQLAAITPERLREIVGDVIQRLADEDSIITQAKELAARKAGGG